MNKEKINELLDKKINREEAKKLLSKEEYKEYETLYAMKAVLSEMKIKAPRNIHENVLNRVHRKRMKRQFYFAMAVSFSMIIVAAILIHNFTPLKSTSPTLNSTPPLTNSASKNMSTEKREIKIETTAPEKLPVLQVKLSDGYTKEALFKELTKCGNVSGDTVEISKKNFEICINTIKNYGTIINNIGNIKNSVEKKSIIKVKIEVIK